MFNLDGLDALFKLAVWGVILTAICGIYGVYKAVDKYFVGTVIETKIKPSINYQLTTDGKEVDTLYIYTFKK
jgi:hypothetical protein